MAKASITVQAGRHERRWTPVTAAVTKESLSQPGPYVLEDDEGMEHPAQVEMGKEEARMTWVVPHLAAGGVRSYTLRSGGEKTEGVSLEDTPQEGVAVSIRGEHFTTYRYGDELARPFLYPVIGPGGAAVTRHFPMRDDVKGEKHDHPHHRSIWFTHGEVNGVDNWSELEGHGRTEHLSFDRIAGGPVYGDLRSQNLWVDNQGNPVLNQDLQLRFYALPTHVRLFDAEVTFHATQGDVTFGDTKEGGLFSVRVTSSMDAAGAGRIEMSTGATGEAESWGRPAAWCHYSGPVQTGGGPIACGIGVIDHPSNPRYPTYWHVRNYGLMTANPFGLSYYYNDKSRDGSLTVKQGERVTFRYRAVVHEGSAADGHMADHYAAFAYPPEVQVKE